MIDFTEKQTDFFRNKNHRWCIKEGATRSGKTFMDFFLIPMRLDEVRDKAGLVVFLGNTKGTLQRNIIEYMQNIYGGSTVSNIGADNTASVFGQKVYCLGADKVSQVNRLRGSSIKYCYCDEVATYSQEVFEMLKSRLDKPYSKCDMTCNPESPAHWLFEFLQNTKGVDLYRQSYCIDDNPKLDPQVVADLKKEYAGTVYYDRYILGKWTKAEGLCYPAFSEKHIITDFAECDKYIVCCDYGIENPCCFILLGQKNKTLFAIKEYYFEGRKSPKLKTDADYVDDLIDFVGKIKISSVVVDPSASSFIVALKRAGLPVRKAYNSVNEGIRTVAGLFAQENLYISRFCENGIKELKSYCWQKDSDPEKPVKEFDHFCDALRYGVMYFDRKPTVLAY